MYQKCINNKSNIPETNIIKIKKTKCVKKRSINDRPSFIEKTSKHCYVKPKEIYFRQQILPPKATERLFSTYFSYEITLTKITIKKTHAIFKLFL